MWLYATSQSVYSQQPVNIVCARSKYTVLRCVREKNHSLFWYCQQINWIDPILSKQIEISKYNNSDQWARVIQ